MRMKKKKILLTLLLSAAIVASAAACGTSTPSVSVSNQENSANTPSTASAVSQSAVESSNTTLSEVSLNKNDDFDFDELCKNIEINGKKYTFPFSLNDLGEGYTFDNIRYLKTDNEKETYKAYADILYNSKKLLDCSIDNLSKEYYKKDNEIKSLPITFISQDCFKLNGMQENTNYIKISDLKIGDTSEDVKNKLGEPHEIIYSKRKKGTLGSYTYYKDNMYGESNVCYAFDENGCIDYLGIIM